MVSRDLDLVLFDLDGTLTDSGPGILSCIEYALEDQGIPFPERDKCAPTLAHP
jgi:phosphoglycolate phosphatase